MIMLSTLPMFWLNLFWKGISERGLTSFLEHNPCEMCVFFSMPPSIMRVIMFKLSCLLLYHVSFYEIYIYIYISILALPIFCVQSCISMETLDLLYFSYPLFSYFWQVIILNILEARISGLPRDLVLFHFVWLQVFVFLAAEYETPKNSLNQVRADLFVCIYIWNIIISIISFSAPFYKGKNKRRP